MNNELLDKHQNDPSWAEVVRLYSGLFDTQDERENFILDLSDTNILLAAECKTSSSNIQNNLQFELSEKADYLLNNSPISEPNYQASLYALSELSRVDLVSQHLARIKNRNIPIIRLILENLPETIESKNIVITAVLSNPSFFFNAFLTLLERFEQKKIFLTETEIYEIFDALINQRENCEHVLSFIKKYQKKIEKIPKYDQYARGELCNIRGYENLLLWLRFFELNIQNVDLIQILLNQPSINSLQNVLFCLENIDKDSKIGYLNKMLNSDNPTVLSVCLIYINSDETLLRIFGRGEAFQKYKYFLGKGTSERSQFQSYFTFSKKASKLSMIIRRSNNPQNFADFNIQQHINVGDVTRK
ncbi:MAG: hypothetical protein NTW16_01840 [Bacteroidetes bacterium]|nr:hypothetical protein [Bacteroidota bacterium]